MLNLQSLNEEQRMAVTHGEGPLLVLAGPGSGKTFTITQRILYLLEVMKVPAEQILVITFTNEAAASMQRRFNEQARQVQPVNFGTFHSIFYHILKQSNASCTGKLLQDNQKRHLISSLLQNNNAEDAKLFLSAISYYKNTGDQKKAEEMLPETCRNKFSYLFTQYEKRRKEQGTMDFDDMIYECANLLEHNPKLREYWRKRYSHILMDEFQDINPMQYRVIRQLVAPPYNLFAVGDDDQAIYGFRGSKPACMKQFVADFQAKTIFLSINYRSTPEIVNASLRVIETNRDRFAKKLTSWKKTKVQEKDVGKSGKEKLDKRKSDKRKSDKRKSDKRKSEEEVKLLRFREKEEQYSYLMQQLEKHLKDTGNDTGTCAVLFRTNIQMQAFAARLKKRGILYEMKEKTGNLYDHFIIADIMAYLKIAAGSMERKWYLQILNKPMRYISREAVYDKQEVCGESGDRSVIGQMRSYYQTRPKEAFGALRAIALLEKQLDYLKKAAPYAAVQYICKVIGYEDYLVQQSRILYQSAQRLEEWKEILEFVREEAGEYSTTAEWIEDIRSGRKCERGEISDRGRKIYLMTVHGSKGLEFDTVYIPDCNEKIFPHGNMPDRESCEEECRIFYVAMTRAKKSLELLYLTGTKERPRLPSRFLNPLFQIYSSTSSSNSQLSRYSSKASATFSYSSSSSMQRSSGSSLGSSGFSR